MFINYIKTILRSYKRHLFFSLINIMGLAIGIASVILILLWINDQLSYDKFVKNRNEIYRLEAIDWVGLPAFFLDYINNVPEIDEVVRIADSQNSFLLFNKKSYDVSNLVFADSVIYDFFNFNYILGTKEQVRNTPFSLVITESTAQRIFGNNNPIGKLIRYNGKFQFTVTGVIKDIEQFHKPIEAIAPINCLPILNNTEDYLNQDRWNYFFYLQIKDNIDIRKLEKKLNYLVSKEIPKFWNNNQFVIRPFNKIYFANNLSHEGKVIHGNVVLIFLFASVVIAILIIACINFINLTIAQSYSRKKEIGVRKVIGASKIKLIIQFLFESFISVCIATYFGIILIELFLSHFNTFTQDYIDLRYSSPKIILSILVLFFFTILTAGLIPSYHMASINPLSLFKSEVRKKTGLINFRNFLIVFQFTISVILICCTLAVTRQLNFIEHKDLGFETKNIINIKLKGYLLSANKQLFRERLLNNKNILQVSLSDQIPGAVTSTNSWIIDGEKKPIVVLNADPEFIELFDIKILKGRNLSRNNKGDYGKRVLINEEAEKYFGLKNSINHHLKSNWGDTEIIGIFNNIHFNSLHNKVNAVAIVWDQEWANNVNIKIKGENIHQTINFIKDVWMQFYPESLFNYSFVDKVFASQYKKEKNLLRMLIAFSLLAIILASLGILALSVLKVDRKTKEIALRKIYGSQSIPVVFILFKVFVQWILISFLIASPIAYFLIEKWLQNFAYRIEVGVGIFFIAWVFTLLIALITIVYAVMKAARKNPVESLRYE